MYHECMSGHDEQTDALAVEQPEMKTALPVCSRGSLAVSKRDIHRFFDGIAVENAECRQNALTSRQKSGTIRAMNVIFRAENEKNPRRRHEYVGIPQFFRREARKVVVMGCLAMDREAVFIPK
jgi:hypothetical protein